MTPKRIVLSVIEPAGEDVQPSVTLAPGGRLTIGRGGLADWVLPDRERRISRRHCVIEDTPAGCRLTDTSANGVFVNDDPTRVLDYPDSAVFLADGDRLTIGPYRVGVAIGAAVGEAVPPAPAEGPDGSDLLDDRPPPARPAARGPEELGVLGMPGRPLAAAGRIGRAGQPAAVGAAVALADRGAEVAGAAEACLALPGLADFGPALPRPAAPLAEAWPAAGPQPVPTAAAVPSGERAIRLELIGAAGEADGTRTFAGDGHFFVGSSPDNDWVLNDAAGTVAAAHCRIDADRNGYRLVDLSRDGVFLNEMDEPVLKRPGRTARLADGDWLQIGGCTVIVRLIGGAAAAAEAPAPHPTRPSPAAAALEVLASPARPGAAADPTAPPAASLPAASLPAALPPPLDAARLVAALAEGAGLDPAALTEPPEVILERAGRSLRALVEGLGDALAARRAVRRALKVDVTEWQSAANNPLKFGDADERLRALLAAPKMPFLAGDEAVRTALKEICDHELAVLAGMQQAWLELLRRFDPAKAERAVAAEGDGLVGRLASRKARCWDAFVLLYRSLCEESEDDAGALFKGWMSRGYQEQIEKLGKRGS